MKFVGRKFRKTFFCIVISIVLMCSSVMASGMSVHAETITQATITGEGVNFREGAGTNYTSIGVLSYGTIGTYLGKGTASNGAIWYKLTIGEKTGWVHSNYVELTDIVSDAAFETYLASQQFPESYKSALRILHSKYPNWVFEAQHTNLDWNTVMKAESVLGKNLVSGTSIASWKSTQNGAYDWETSTWKTGFDTGNWVAASPEIIAHYMDPRNFLDFTYVFLFLKQSYNPSAMDRDSVRAGLVKMVGTSFLSGTCPGTEPAKAYVDVILEAAEKTGVSPYYLAASILQEVTTSTGTSDSISGTLEGYEGYYNYYNIAAYAHDGRTAIQNGLLYAKTGSTYGRPWNTHEKAIVGGAQFFADGYINVGQDTLYLKKFNVQGSNPYTHQYMTNVQGAWSESAKLSRAYTSDLRSAALVFKIPVYTNMPESACAKPTGNLNPNYMLKSLKVNGTELIPQNPGDAIYVTSYNATVPADTTSVTISATPCNSKAKVTGTGTVDLTNGAATVKLVVTAENGKTREYVININGGSGDVIVPSVTTPTISSSSLTIFGGMISGLKAVPTSAASMMSSLSVQNGSIKVLKADGSENTGNIGTGNMLVLYDTTGSKKEEYQIIVYGDTDGNGSISALDLLKVKKHIVKASSLSGAYSTAADVNKDGKINALDLLQIKKHIVKEKQIQQ